jgi:FAD/FMN-containing dehydrogenase
VGSGRLRRPRAIPSTRQLLNYLGDDTTPAEVAAAYGPNLPRLAALKGQYDPDNFFHMNQIGRNSSV